LAFALPMIEMLLKNQIQFPLNYSKRGRYPKILIMAPTRELAMQVHKEFDSMLFCNLGVAGSFKSCCVYGGTPYDSQYSALKDGLDVVCGTPGRLMDHIDRGNLVLSELLFICLDEAD
jgi:ATP-dependent RNA helicase DDX21